MSKTYSLINRIEKLDATKKDVDKKTFKDYKKIVIALQDLINTIQKTKITDPRKKCLILCF